jgi:hypothetical protein
LTEEDLTLAALARVAPEPYRQIFSDHRAAFLELVNEVQSVSQTNRRLATRGLQGLNEVLSMLSTDDADVHLYGPQQQHVARAAATAVDQAL